MRYLLGTLSDEERDRFEEMYFSDNAAFEEVEIAEGELIDRYVRGELARSDHARFEAVLAGSSRLAERVQFARVWKDKLAASSTSQRVGSKDKPRESGTGWWARLFGSSAESRVPGLALAFGVLLVLVGGGTLFAGWLRLREESRQLAAQQSAIEQRQRELDKQAADLRSQMDQLTNRTATPKTSETPLPTPSDISSPSQTHPVLAFTLSAGNARSANAGEKRDFDIAPGTSRVEISLKVPDTSYVSYEATIKNADRGPVFKSSVLKIRGSGGILTVSVSAKKLLPGDYSISLTGRTPSGVSEGVADYSFRISK